MRKVISTLSFLSLLFFAYNANSQACSTHIECTPLGGPASGGFEDASSTPCAVQGVAYNHAIQFTMFATFDFAGHQTVDSIQFLTIDNLPCGLCWDVDQTDKTYSANEDGCLSIRGTTNDAPGQYKMALSLKAWINHQPGAQTIPANLVDQTGIRILMRVNTPTGTCVTPDTSVNANNLTASLSCTSGINETGTAFSGVSLVPNPMNSTGTLSFVSEKNALYTLRISDAIGNIVSLKEVEAKQGENIVSIERNNLPNGIYFIALSDGKNVATHRFSMAE